MAETGGADDKVPALEQQQDRRLNGSDDYRQRDERPGLHHVGRSTPQQGRKAKKRASLGRLREERRLRQRRGVSQPLADVRGRRCAQRKAICKWVDAAA